MNKLRENCTFSIIKTQEPIKTYIFDQKKKFNKGLKLQHNTNDQNYKKKTRVHQSTNTQIFYPSEKIVHFDAHANSARSIHQFVNTLCARVTIPPS